MAESRIYSEIVHRQPVEGLGIHIEQDSALGALAVVIGHAECPFFVVARRDFVTEAFDGYIDSVDCAACCCCNLEVADFIIVYSGEFHFYAVGVGRYVVVEVVHSCRSFYPTLLQQGFVGVDSIMYPCRVGRCAVEYRGMSTVGGVSGHRQPYRHVGHGWLGIGDAV